MAKKKDDPIIGVDTEKLDKLWQATEKKLGEDVSSQTLADRIGSYANQVNRVRKSGKNVKLSSLQSVIDGLQSLAHHDPPPVIEDFVQKPTSKKSAPKPPDAKGEPRTRSFHGRWAPLKALKQPPLNIVFAGLMTVIVVLAMWVSYLQLSKTGLLTENKGLRNAAERQAENHATELKTLRQQLRGKLKADGLPEDSAFVSEYLAALDQNIFYSGKDGLYEFTRILPDNQSLYNETEFERELDETVTSFDILANTAGVVRERWLPIIERGLRRGVSYRIILSDYRKSNTNLDAFQNAMGEKMQTLARTAVAEHHHQLQELINRIDEDAKRGRDRQFHGTLEVRWNPKLLLYSMWIRDGRSPEAIGHLGVHFYQGKNFWPCIRASKRTAPRALENMMNEYDHAFDQSLKYDAMPYPPSE